MVSQFQNNTKKIELKGLKHSHDRFLLIDEKIYHLGASLKDLGKKWFAFSLMEEDTFELKRKIGEVLDENNLKCMALASPRPLAPLSSVLN